VTTANAPQPMCGETLSDAVIVDYALTTTLYATAVYPVVVCLAVTSRHCTKMVKRRITQITPYDSPGILIV